jgi:hypothetical protein
MTQQLKVNGAAALPFEDGTNVAPIDLTAVLTYTSRADFSRSYSGAVTDDPVDFGTLAGGAKALIIKASSGACTIKFNGDTHAWPIGVGGYMLWINPATPFPTAALITTLAAASILFIALG